jgi:hypothetical protein
VACVKHLSDALIHPKSSSKLADLDLQKCGLTSETVKPIAGVLLHKYKLRTLLLTNNGITDEGARELLAATQINPYILKFKMDLNPTRYQFSKEIEQVCAANQQKVGG